MHMHEVNTCSQTFTHTAISASQGREATEQALAQSADRLELTAWLNMLYACSSFERSQNS